ncbi:MAG: adenylate/guanylate cyclase domain-containing protein [Verrucomicrobiia bacterium]
MDHDSKQSGWLTLPISLGVALTGIAILTSVMLGVTTFYSVRSFVRQGVQERLADAVGIAALKLDGDLHATLRDKGDESTAAYQEIRRYLRTIRDTAKDIRFAYTARMDKRGKMVFVVDAEENPKEASHIGDAYEEASNLMREAFRPPYGVRVEKQFVTDRWGVFLSGYAPIFKKNGEFEALLGIDITAQKVLDYERHYLLMICLICLGVCALAVALGAVLARRISKPLLLLEADMSRIQTFDLGGSPVIRSRIVEVIRMKNAVENMKSGLRSFKKYVPAELVAELIKLRKEAVLGAQKRELSVFFSDIAGFTSIAEGLSPELLSQNLGVYFEAMTGTLLSNQGTVDKYIGDAIMAFWGAPVPVENHAMLACRAAIQCQRRVDKISTGFVTAGLPPFVTRIGINTGEAIVGNMGYKDRLSYTAVGDTVNLASRLEGLNKHYGTRILISESTYDKVRDDFVARPVDMVAVKGKSTGVRIYELLVEKDRAGQDALAFVSLCEEGMRLYLCREWAKAGEVFRTVLQARPDDQPAQTLAERCVAYEKDPPPPDWNGVTIMQEK